MMTNHELLNELILLKLNEECTPEQFEELQEILKNDVNAVEYYVEFMMSYSGLVQPGDVSVKTAGYDSDNELSDDIDYTPALLKTLSQIEQEAPALDIPDEIEPDEIEVVHPSNEKVVVYKMSRSSRYTIMLTAAAVIMIALFARFWPIPVRDIATISQSSNAIFADASQTKAGTRLFNRKESYWLQKGIIHISFDYGAQVVIEAPAEFKLDNELEMSLTTGRIYAYVPPRSSGFMVETPFSRIMDLGTEFGVKVDFDGSSNVHMIKGKASLIPGLKGNSGKGELINAGQARNVNKTGRLQTIPLRENEFARGFNPHTGFIWRGEDIDVADLAACGNGLGTGREHSLDPISGVFKKIAENASYPGSNTYALVKESPFIDGVFTPDGSDGEIKISSTGILWQAPSTCTLYKYAIRPNVMIPINANQYTYTPGIPVQDEMMALAATGTVPVRLMGIMPEKVSPDTNLFIHSNLGITFDLAEIRKLLPMARIASFNSRFGIGEISFTPVDLDVTILVDGEVRLSKVDLAHTDVLDIDVELNDNDRFLTLVVTDSDTVISDINVSAHANDWGLFMNPIFKTERR